MFQFQIIPFGSPLFDEAIELRKTVLRDPLNLEFYIEDIEKEWNQIHLGIYRDNVQLLGVSTILLYDAETAKVRQVAIHPNYQNQGLGSKLNEYVESVAKSIEIAEIILHARETAVPFYEKNGYSKMDNKVFEEVGIPHFKMHKKLV